jgi:hypothetical protein
MYKHTQVGQIILVIAAPVLLILAFWAAIYPILSMIITIAALVILLGLFSALTVACDAEKLSFYFGPGIIRKTIKYGEIKTIEKVRNRWYYGWGVRWYGRGWLYNVSGLDAIEITLNSGSQLRLGTNEPDKLMAFIKSKIVR